LRPGSITHLVNEQPFGIRSSWESDTVIFEVVGELDMLTGPELKAAVGNIQDAAGHVVVDLTPTTFLDSVAIHNLVLCRGELADRDVSFCVVCPEESLARRTLEITNVLELLSVVGSHADRQGSVQPADEGPPRSTNRRFA
jgi:anti-sigma B factor antagonist